MVLWYELENLALNWNRRRAPVNTVMNPRKGGIPWITEYWQIGNQNSFCGVICVFCKNFCHCMLCHSRRLKPRQEAPGRWGEGLHAKDSLNIKTWYATKHSFLTLYVVFPVVFSIFMNQLCRFYQNFIFLFQTNLGNIFSLYFCRTCM